MKNMVDDSTFEVKQYERGCCISRRLPVKADTEGRRKISREGIKRGEVTSFSLASRRRLRETLLAIRPANVSGDGYFTFGLCLTIPNPYGKDSLLTDEQAAHFAALFRKMFKAWRNDIERKHDGVSYVWRVELQQSQMPHVHLFAVCSLDSISEHRRQDGATFENVEGALRWNTFPREKWLPNVFAPAFAPRRVHWENVDIEGYSLPLWMWDCRAIWLRQLRNQGLYTPDADTYACDIQTTSAVHYLCEHTTKQKQAQLGWAGRQWGIINRAAADFGTCKGVIVQVMHERGLYARILARLEAQRKIDYCNEHRPEGLKPWTTKTLSERFRRRWCCDYDKRKPSDLVDTFVSGNGQWVSKEPLWSNRSEIMYRDIITSGARLSPFRLAEMIHSGLFHVEQLKKMLHK